MGRYKGSQNFSEKERLEIMCLYLIGFQIDVISLVYDVDRSYPRKLALRNNLDKPKKALTVSFGRMHNDRQSKTKT